MAKIKKICIDAGHYAKYNRSPVVKAYYESEMTWKLHLLLKQYLEGYGFEVITTRKDQAKDLALYSRGKTAKGCDLFLSLHSNAVGGKVGNESVDRVMVYAPLSGKCHDLAQKLADCIVSVMETKQGGYVKTRQGKSGEYYGVLRGAAAVNVPGLLVEHSFHTNTRSTKWLLDDNNLDKMAKAEAKVIADYFGMTEKRDQAEAPKVEEKPAEKTEAFEPYLVKITASVLNVRKGPGTNYAVRRTVKKGGVYTIVEEARNGSTVWVKLKSGAGWISLSYTKKV